MRTIFARFLSNTMTFTFVLEQRFFVSDFLLFGLAREYFSIVCVFFYIVCFTSARFCSHMIAHADFQNSFSILNFPNLFSMRKIMPDNKFETRIRAKTTRVIPSHASPFLYIEDTPRNRASLRATNLPGSL